MPTEPAHRVLPLLETRRRSYQVLLHLSRRLAILGEGQQEDELQTRSTLLTSKTNMGLKRPIRQLNRFSHVRLMARLPLLLPSFREEHQTNTRAMLDLNERIRL